MSSDEGELFQGNRGKSVSVHFIPADPGKMQSYRSFAILLGADPELRGLLLAPGFQHPQGTVGATENIIRPVR